MHSSKAHTLLVEFDGLGHRFHHVRLLAERALAQGHRVTLMTRPDKECREHMHTHLGDLVGVINLRWETDRRWGSVERAAREIGATTTVVPEADNVVIPLLRRRGWRGPGELSLQIMRARVTRFGSYPRWMAAVLVKGMCVSLLFLLPRVRFHVLRSPLDPRRRVWPPVHDPIGMTATDADAARVRDDWALERGRYWFGVVGAVTPNKHLPLVIESSCMAAAMGSPRLGLLVAGRIAPEVARDLPRLLEQAGSSGLEVVVVDRLLSDHELDAAIRAVDCLVLAYDLNAPSGTLGKAVVAGTRVVAAGSPALARDCRQVPNSAEWCAFSATALAHALTRATGSPRPTPVELPGEQRFARALLGS